MLVLGGCGLDADEETSTATTPAPITVEEGASGPSGASGASGATGAEGEEAEEPEPAG